MAGIKNKELMEAVKDDEPADLEEASAKLESEVKKLVDVQRAIRRMTGDAYHVQMVARDANGTTIVTSGTSKRIPREHLERFREEAKSHGSIEEMLEAYARRRRSRSRPRWLHRRHPVVMCRWCLRLLMVDWWTSLWTDRSQMWSASGAWSEDVEQGPAHTQRKRSAQRGVRLELVNLDEGRLPT